MQIVNCDVCLLTETKTTNVRIDGAKYITAKKSVADV